MLDPNLIRTLFTPNLTHRCLLSNLTAVYCVRYIDYTHFRFKSSHSIFQLKTGILIFHFYPQILTVKQEKAVFRYGWTDIVEKYRYA